MILALCRHNIEGTHRFLTPCCRLVITQVLVTFSFTEECDVSWKCYMYLHISKQTSLFSIPFFHVPNFDYFHIKQCLLNVPKFFSHPLHKEYGHQMLRFNELPLNSCPAWVFLTHIHLSMFEVNATHFQMWRKSDYVQT